MDCGQVMIGQRQHSGRKHAPQVRGDHDPYPQQPVDGSDGDGASSSTGRILASRYRADDTGIGQVLAGLGGLPAIP